MRYFHNVSITIKRYFNAIRVGIIGSGPAGFYTAQALLKNKDVTVDIYEKFPVPFGLIRFGVAPDHQSVKNVINSFTSTALEPRVNFYGNIAIGSDLSLSELRQAYNAVVLCYGSAQDRQLEIKGENLGNVIPARQFVGWYNGVPADKNLSINLNTDTAVIIGQGNVAIDCARILLSPVDQVLEKTDITGHALRCLKESQVRTVYIVGRRGPLQVSFTIKEFRELTKLPDCDTIVSAKDFRDIDENTIDNLQRPRKRLTQLIQSQIVNSSRQGHSRKCHLLFYRSPLEILGDNNGQVSSLTLGINKLDENENAVLTDERESLNTGLLLKSIGYKAVAIDPSIPIDQKKGTIANLQGKVIDIDYFNLPPEEKRKRSEIQFAKGLYCSGWAATGATGVILGTMGTAFETAGCILSDLENQVLDERPGSRLILQLLKERNVNVVSFNDWQKIDVFERNMGEKLGKPREKLVNEQEMLGILKKPT